MKNELEIIKSCKSIAIMGGTFDPIHNGHLVTAEAVLHRFNVDKVIFMPAGNPYHKDKNTVTNNEHRYLMTVLATMRNPNFYVSRIEIERTGKTYTIDTIEELKKICRHDVRLYFISGADAIHQILTWKDSEKLLKSCNFVAVTRPGYKKNTLFDEIDDINKKYGTRIYYMEVPALAISSSDIRNRVKIGMPIKYLLPESVEEYIYKFGLYDNPVQTEVNFMLSVEEMKEKLQSALSVKRYIHTMGVEEEAVKLAEIYGTGETKIKARIAALLHDCAKNYPSDLKRRLCKEYHIEIDDIMDKQIDLVHPFLGAEIARREYLVDDEDILNSIRYHTTGRKHMSQLERIIFIADYIEAGRKTFDGLEEARRIAYIDLDLAMKYILQNTLKHLKNKDKIIHPLSEEAYEYYKNK